MLAWDYRFVTTLETSAPVEAGVLRGDLVVRGGGDPTINTRNGRGAAVFAEWIAALKAAGITRIDGRIVGDDQAFDDEGLGGGWAWDDLQYGYAAPVGALQYNEDIAELTVKPGAVAGDPAVVTLTSGSGLTLDQPGHHRSGRHARNRRVSAGARSSGPRGHGHRAAGAGVAARRRDTAPHRCPSGRRRQSDVLLRQRVQGRTRRERDRGRWAIRSISTMWREARMPARRRIGVCSCGRSRRRCGRSPSVLMKVSQNLYAETLVKAAGAASGRGGSVRGGRAAIQSALRQWQIDDRLLVLADGSGLSRYNFLTAQLLGHILERMYSDVGHREPFVASLPVAGKDGTISTRMRRSRAEGNAVAKTGSIANVRALSGYVRTRDGEMLLFSIIANDFVIPAATVNWIADLGVEVLANFTRTHRSP